GEGDVRPRRRHMFHRIWIGAGALAATLCLSVAGAKAEEAKYPNWEGLWKRGSPVGVWDPTKPPGLGQQPPLTAEYQKVLEANLARGEGAVFFGHKGTRGAGRVAGVDDFLGADGNCDPAQGHIHAFGVHEPDPAHLYRRTGLAQGSRSTVQRHLYR